MIVRRTPSGTVTFQEAPNKATHARPEHIDHVLEFPFDDFPACWEFNETNGKFFSVDPVEGHYAEEEMTAEQFAAVASLIEFFEEIKEVEGVYGDEW